MSSVTLSAISSHKAVLEILRTEHRLLTEFKYNPDLTSTFLTITKDRTEIPGTEAMFSAIDKSSEKKTPEKKVDDVLAISTADVIESCTSLLIMSREESKEKGEVCLVQVCKVNNPRAIHPREFETAKSELDTVFNHHDTVCDSLAMALNSGEKVTLFTGMDAMHAVFSTVAAFGDLDIISKLAENICYATATVPSYFTSALITAAEKGHLAVVKLLCELYDVPLDAVDENGFSSLCTAALGGHREVVEYLIKKGDMDVNDEHNKVSPLFLAAQNGHTDVVRLLLSNGSDVDETAKTYAQFTPLMAAAFHGHDDVVKLLLDAGANIEARSTEDFTPLMLAAQRGHHNSLALLLSRGAQIKARNRDNWTALMLVVYNGAPFETVKLLLVEEDAEFNVAARTRDGKTLLMLASYAGQLEVVKYLLDRGADVTLMNEDDTTAFMAAAENGHKEVIKLLLAAPNAGEVIDHRCDQTLTTALMLAAQNGYGEITSALIQAKCKLEIQDYLGSTALTHAIDKLQEGTAKILCEAGADVNHRNLLSRTPLMLAAQHDTLSGVVKLLIEKGAELNAVDDDCLSALLISAIHGTIFASQVLLDCGADVKFCDKFGCNCLILAAKGGHKVLTESLLSRKAISAMINNTDLDGKTALQYAKLRGYNEIAAFLVRNGAVDYGS